MTKIIKIKINDYQTTNDNPYAYYHKSPKSLAPIAQVIDEAIKANFANQKLLFRFVQSGKKDLSRSQYIDQILVNGNDKIGDYVNQELADVNNIDLYAGVYDFEAGLEDALTKLHKFKPKCDEKPQYIYDLLMIFDANFYQQTDYLHPRHKIIVKDGYCLKEGTLAVDALLGLIVIN